uniref:Basic helix-loop-helix-containing protein n=1 Tax=Rhizophora mucronata TaxID=61149 RepID=A0A2P2NN03_RHIMU
MVFIPNANWSSHSSGYSGITSGLTSPVKMLLKETQQWFPISAALPKIPSPKAYRRCDILVTMHPIEYASEL